MTYMFSECNNLKKLTLGKNIKNIAEGAELPNGGGWANAKAPKTVVSGDGEYAVIENAGKNTYIRANAGNSANLSLNIKVEYSKQYHQIRFTWDEVNGTDEYAVAVYLSGKWKVIKRYITKTSYTTPKNLTPGRTYKVAIAAEVNGVWRTDEAIKDAVTVTVK
jgi:hypothetical protein